MKKTVRVTITKDLEIYIPDHALTDMNLKEFSSYMFRVECTEEMFKHAGSYVARFNDCNVEGVGPVTAINLYEDVTTEILK